jgi:SAM-dependent methyltransferase
VSRNPYETDRYLHEYLLFHFGTPRQICPHPIVPREALQFHRRILQRNLLPVRSRRESTGLDVGCAVGRMTFELARKLGHVTGVDNSRTFIRAAQRMQRTGMARVRVHDEGSRYREINVRHQTTGQVSFQVGDAQNLGKLAGAPFDVVAAINLMCRLPEPRRFFAQLPELVKPTGQLILASPFSWLPEYTASSRWIHSDELLALLRPHFHMARHNKLPFVIREHSRKYQFVFSDVFTFIRL